MTFKFSRRFLLVYGLLVFGHSAYADTVPVLTHMCAASGHPYTYVSGGHKACSLSLLCRLVVKSDSGIMNWNETSFQCSVLENGDYKGNVWNPYEKEQTYCPTGYKRDINGNTCSRPDCPMFGTPEGDTAPSEKPDGCTCPDGTKWVSMNGCRKKCGSWNSGEKVAGFGTVYGPGQKNGCSQGCEIQPSVEGFEYPDGSFLGISDTYTGWACPGTGPGSGGNNPVKDNPTPKEPPKEPPCPTGYGVLTSTSGSVGCVPPGEPDKKIPDGRKPVVEKTVKKETYPDGSEKTTKTTKTKDPGTGATNTSSTTTSTGGMAGPAGTTTGTETKTGGGKGTGTGSGGDGEGDCEGEDCSGEGFDGPDGDLYEKKDRTMRDALEDFSAAVSDAPTMVAARNWFSIGGMPAGCGGLSVTVPYLNTTISADSIFCGEYGALIMQIAGAVVLAAAAYAGFRIAIL